VGSILFAKDNGCSQKNLDSLLQVKC
jgi:hypothetical protein